MYESKHVETFMIDDKLVVFWLKQLSEYSIFYRLSIFYGTVSLFTC